MSVFELVGELCLKIFDSEVTNSEWHPDLPKLRLKALKKLRSKCFEILLNKVYATDSVYENDWNPVAQIVGHVFTLQQQGMFKDAKKMEKCAKTMLDTQIYKDPTVLAILELLLRLQDSVPRKEDYDPVLFRYKQPKLYNPADGPMPYDIMHPSVFQPQPWMLHLSRIEKDSTGFFPGSGIFSFDAEPGQNLPVLGRFLQPVRYDGVGSKVELYTFPEIPALTQPRGLFIPQLTCEKVLADDGYATSSQDDSSVASPCARTHEDPLLEEDAVWEAALAYDPPRLRTWESLGKRIVLKEKPFLSEAGQDAAKHFIEVNQEWPCIQEGPRTVPQVVSKVQLLRDIGYLLLGVESHTFPFSQEEFSFRLASGICMDGISIKGMDNFCKELIELGTCTRRLQLLVERGVPCHPRTQLMEALRENINTYLQFHWGAALLMGRDISMVALQHWVHGLHRKTVAIAQLCGVAPASDSWAGPRQLPSGMALVSYIYEAFIQETRPDVCCILYSTLQSVSRVYFRFLQQWIFKGCLNDTWEEFFILTSASALTMTKRDRKYWTQVFQVIRDAVPGFLRGLEEDIMLCGKTVHLLKMCCPKAALCVALESGHPTMTCCLGGRNLHTLTAQCKAFENEVKKLQQSRSDRGIEASASWRLRHPSDKEVLERQETIRQARERHVLRVKLEKEASRQAVVQKQQKWMAELQLQKEENRALREEVKNQERQEELQMLEFDKKCKEEEDQRKMEEKQRIMDYYEELSEIATKRKQLADWKLERLNLRDRRKDFLLNEVKSVTAELNLRNLEKSCSNTTLTIIEEDADLAITVTPIENPSHTLTLPLKTTTTSDYNEIIATGVDNNLADKASPNNNTINDSLIRGDVNKNVNSLVLNLQQSNRNIIPEKLMGTNNEDDALRNVSLKLNNPETHSKNDNSSGGLDNSAFSVADAIKLKIHEQEYGIMSNQTNVEFQEIEKEVKPEHFLTAAEKNRQKIMEQEFGITARQIEPKSVPLKCAKDVFQDHIQSNTCEETFIKNFQNNVVQRHANRWHMLHGDTNIITGAQNPFCSVPSLQSEHKEPFEIDSISNKVTPSDDGKQALTSPMSVDTRMSKSESSGSVNHIFKTSSGLSSKTGSSYNIMSIASSSSFDLGSGKFSLNTPTSTDNGSVDTFRTCSSSGEITSSSGESCCERRFSFPYWRSQRLEVQDKVDMKEVVQCEQSSNNQENTSNSSDPDFSSDRDDFSDSTAINVALQKSVAIPLYTQLRLANEAVLEYFFEDLDLFGHFLSLRSYFFLMDGEFSRTMSNTLFQKIATVRRPNQLLNYVALNGILRKALDSSLYTGEGHANRLSFKVSSSPDYFHLASTDVLDCLSLQYRSEWPLNIIITNECLLRYNMIFSFLIKVRLVSWRLEQCFNWMKGAKGKDFGKGSEQYHKIQIWRHTMTHFVRTFQNYIMSIALQSSWEDFENHLNEAQTLDELHQRHAGYVKKVLFRCLLYKHCRSLRNILMNVFNTILKFHAQLETSPWECTGSDNSAVRHPDFQNLRKIYVAFKSRAAMFYKFIEKLINAGYQTHLCELLEMRNMNDFYSHIESG